jgi:phosphoribosylpyrophosphate synthetase
VAFPDDGAKKRFELLFRRAGFDIIVCGKVRDGERRIVTVQDGDPRGKNVVIVDDLVQTGGTLYECAQALRAAGAIDTYAYAAHGVFPLGRWKDFSRKLGGRRAVFEKFWLTNSQPTVCNQLPTDDVFEVIDLLPQIISDLDMK